MVSEKRLYFKALFIFQCCFPESFQQCLKKASRRIKRSKVAPLSLQGRDPTGLPLRQTAAGLMGWRSERLGAEVKQTQHSGRRSDQRTSAI